MLEPYAPTSGSSQKVRDAITHAVQAGKTG
jgi:hypothetical protein